MVFKIFFGGGGKNINKKLHWDILEGGDTYRLISLESPPLNLAGKSL
jgi:hypothetical protein